MIIVLVFFFWCVVDFNFLCDGSMLRGKCHCPVIPSCVVAPISVLPRFGISLLFSWPWPGAGSTGVTGACEEELTSTSDQNVEDSLAGGSFSVESGGGGCEPNKKKKNLGQKPFVHDVWSTCDADPCGVGG